MTSKFQEHIRPGVVARQLGDRLERIGLNPFSSDKERYVVLLEDAPGEIIELGRPLRGSRIFATEAIRKNRRIVSDFVEFAKVDSLEGCLFWGVGLTGAKASAACLSDALRAFNSRINIEFTELRKKHAFELLLIVIHPRFDSQSGLFDLHAHFVCRIPPANREAARRRLLTKFSKTDLPDKPVRNAGAVSTYMLWGIWKNAEMLNWPDHALAAAWSLTQSRFRLYRAGGAFSKWRVLASGTATKRSAEWDQEKVQKNRSATRYTQPNPKTDDRCISMIKVRYEGRKVRALLFENRNSVPNETHAAGPLSREMYTSATNVATQESEGKVTPTQTVPLTPRRRLWKWPHKASLLVLIKLVKSVGGSIRRRCNRPFTAILDLFHRCTRTERRKPQKTREP